MLFLQVVYCNIKRIILWNFILTSFQLSAAYKQLCGRCVNATASNTMHWGCRQRTWIFWEHRACTWGRSQTWRSASEVEVSAAHFVTGGRTCSSLCRGLRRCSSAVLVSPRTGCRRVRKWVHIPDRHSTILQLLLPVFFCKNWSTLSRAHTLTFIIMFRFSMSFFHGATYNRGITLCNSECCATLLNRQ